MSRMMTLNDLNKRDGGGGSFQGSNFQLGGRTKHSNGCMQCLDAFFPNFKLETITFLFATILTGVFLFTVIVDKIIMGNSNNDPHIWMCSLKTFGAKYTHDIVNNYQIWRLLTSALLHQSFIQLLNNCLGILFVGFTVEEQVKSWKEFVAVLCLGAYEGNVLSAIFEPYQVGTGAGACIWAVVGVGAVWFKLNYHAVGEQFRQFVFIILVLMGCFALLDLLQGTFDIWVHVGGLAVGVPLGVLVLKTSDQQSFRLTEWKRTCQISLVILLVVSTGIMFSKPLPGCESAGCDKICG